MGLSEIVSVIIASVISGGVGYFFGKKQYNNKLKVDAYIEFAPYIRELERLLKVTAIYPDLEDVRTLAINNRDIKLFLKGDYEKIREKFIYCFGDEYRDILDELDKKLIENASLSNREMSKEKFENYISININKIHSVKEKI